MIITTPSPASRIQLAEINLASTDLYTQGDPHLAWQTLRAERPVFWQARADGEGFWAVTRYADVRRVLAEHQTFTSERGTAIAMLDAPDPAAGKMMQATDPPRHKSFRGPLSRPFSMQAVPAYAPQIRLFIREAMSPAADGEIWDAAAAFARLPVAVGAMLMGLPSADIGTLLRLSYASLAPLDPRYNAGTEKMTGVLAHYEIIEYFADRIAERRKNPSADLISHLMSVEVEGRQLTEVELRLNCLSLLLGAVVTTSQAIAAVLIALAEQNGGEGRWPRSMPSPVAVEEALRWSSPVTHFMRRARHDTVIGGQPIRAGDAVAAWIASANRDERVFDQPFRLDLERSPNRHVAFGSGPHRCIGSNLARLMIGLSFQEMVASTDSFELARPPVHLVSNEIAGVVSLPLRLSLSAMAI